MVLFKPLPKLKTIGWQDNLDVRTLASQLFSPGLNLDQDINCHPGVSQVGRFINVCAIPRMVGGY